jgi:hypothetical protein
MQRRQFLKHTSVALATTLAGCGGGDGSVTAQENAGPPPAPPAPTPAPTPAPAPAPGPAVAPPPPPASKFLDVPSQLNEQQTYDSILGWIWTASDKTTSFPANPGPQNHGGNLHDNGEADDLWNHYQAFKRSGNNIYLQWAQRWRDYFVNTYFTDLLNDSFGEHVYGQGLVLWGVDRNDPVALSAAEQICAHIESLQSGISMGAPMSFFGARQRARWLLVATYYSFANPAARWVNLRNRLLDLWMASSDWQDTSNSNLAAGGMYFCGRTGLQGTGIVEPSQYDQGFRANSSFSMAILVDALWRGYKLTARADVRARLIQMARYINHYANNPAHVNAMSGSWWGHANGGYHHPRTNGGSHTNPNTTPADASYEVSHVNTLVIGHKLTGDVTLLNRAQYHFRKGTRFDAGYANAPALCSPTEVHHYIDVLQDSSNPGYFFNNKGELQYCYLLFENGGVPTVEV